MSTTIRNFALALVAMILLPACTRNNGDIGPWFGAWKVESITVNGSPRADYEGNLFIMFQSCVVKFSMAQEHHESIDVNGNWEENNGNMHFSFPDSRFQPQAVTGLPAESDLAVTNQSSRHVTLTWTNPANGAVTVFQLKKWV